MKKLIDKVFEVIDAVFDVLPWILIVGGVAGTIYFCIRVLAG